jgi:hypothetical protein
LIFKTFTAIRGFLVRWAVPLERSIEDALEEGQTNRKYLRRGDTGGVVNNI